MCTNALVGLNDRNNVKLNQIHVLLKWHKDNYYKNVCFDSACTSYKLKLCVKSVLNCEINKSTHIKIVKIRPTQIFNISCVAMVSRESDKGEKPHVNSDQSWAVN